MKAHEFVSERKRRRKPRWAAYGPGPYGGYGYYAGYSGDGGSSGGDGGGGESIKHEASYPGNIGMMELAKFFSMADEEQKTMFKQLLERGKKGLAWKLVQDIVGVKLQGAEFTEGKITLSTDPNWYGAEVGNYKASGPVVNIPANQLVGFEPDDKMNQPKSKANVKKIVAGLKQGDKLPPLLVRKYKDGYQVLDGHHRFWAYKLIGVKSIPAQIVPAKDIEEISKQGVAENFADGKKPGRKGLAKRSGVNTKASVSSLRKTAKNSSGEKARMAHWLANMKAGRAKKNK
jgi:hypothetical protein